MAGNPKDLMLALGTPAKPMGPKPAKASSYLSGKPAQLQTYLMDATDDTRTPEQRAEALCKAIEFQAGETEPDDDDRASPDEGDDSAEY